MSTVTVSSKYQIGIPKDVRDRLDIQPGQKLEAFVLDGSVQLVPVRPVEDVAGIAPGIDRMLVRDPDPFRPTP